MSAGKIAIRELVKVFRSPAGGEVRAIDGLSFGVPEGAFVSVLGPSGCGKSTLLNIMAGLDRPTSGEIQIDGRAITDQDRPRIGFVFQQPRLLPWRTIEGNLWLPLERTGNRAAGRAVIERYVELVGLRGFERYYPGQISGGMQQRVAIARALIMEPEILLMDEPFSNLDEMTARKMRAELIRIWQKTGKTIIFVTHDISEAIFLSTRVILTTRRPARIYRDLSIDLPVPRRYDDDRLFEIEKEVMRDFLQYMEDTEGAPPPEMGRPGGAGGEVLLGGY
ncbi:MAG: ABC transporter ATP-binding protein [Deltaproteobacteria bacterium]|nr:ABC transporter ATP-binding protein [Deltaproteobacteria bacterium]MBI3078127.1 ABC transporter ATP-binding protein [Deltaproteobacteria bacterium]